MFVFSCVSTTGRYESGKRSVVTLKQDKRWYCQSCRYSPSCKHVPHAVTFAVEAGILDESEEPRNLPFVQMGFVGEFREFEVGS